jgi:2-oxoisovalerate dehydrogenase E1 component alpha subunit
MSYRVSHHSTSDDSFAYRDRKDWDNWRTRTDPLARLRRWLENKDLWNAELEKKHRASIRREVLQEISSAEKAKKPALRAIFDDVYEELSDEQEEQRASLRALMEQYPAEYDVQQHEGGIDGL